MRYKSINNQLFVKNRRKLACMIKADSMVIVHSNEIMPRTGDQFYPYRQNSDLFYLTGIEQPHSILALCPQHPDSSLHEVLFIYKATEKDDIWLGHYLSKEEATLISGIKTICWFEEFGHVISEIMKYSKEVYLNEIPVKMGINKPVNLLEEKLKGLFPGHTYSNLTKFTTELRMVKELEELELMKKAAEITEKAFKRMIRSVKPGAMEYQLEAELLYEFTRQGGSGVAFDTIIASGADSCILHYVKNDKQLREGELVLIDFGAEYANYAADCSRVLPVSGRFTDRQRELYEAVNYFHDEAVKLMKPGTTIEAINKALLPVMQDVHVDLGLYNKEDIEKQAAEFDLCKKYFMHSLSHFLGIDVHDVGSKKQILQPGMVITCEPGLYVRNEGIGIRLENDILITEDEAVNMTKDIPMKASDIESLMKP